MKLEKGYYEVMVVQRNYSGDEIDINGTIGYYDEEFDVRPWTIIGSDNVFDTYNKDSKQIGMFVKPIKRLKV